MSNILTFEQDIADAKRLLKEDSTTKLLYDTRYHLFALQIQDASQDSILPIIDSQELDLKKHVVTPLQEMSNKLNGLNKASADNSEWYKAGGSNDSVANMPSSTNEYILIFGLIIAFLSTCLILSKLRKSS